ncbi:Uncharacterised protein [Listeria grayi]|uniref:Uncharacterized protein n=1 Tax=Listeria grayi TaxID=1641 RepID=A0A378MDN5_LISGR|nr:Uncharacterised protein [Listeria grayi]
MLSLTVLLSVFLFAEALLIFVTKRKGNMPTLRKSRRGKLIGAFQLKNCGLFRSFYSSPEVSL